MTLCISVERRRDVSTDHNLLQLLRQIKELPKVEENQKVEEIPTEPIDEELQLLES
jgi:hypothetical protein